MGVSSQAILPQGTATAALSFLFPQKDEYIHDPVGWAEDNEIFIWSKQIEIAESVRDNTYTAVPACHGPGKSYSAGGVIIPWWLNVHNLGEAFVVTTAPSWSQVQAVLWREIRRAHRKLGLRGRVTLDCLWYMGEGRSNEELIAIGRKPADYDEQAFQGIHARYPLIVIDEAGGVEERLYDAVLTLATNENARVLAIGNPDDPNSRFASICKPGSGWNVIRIPVWETPNFTGEPIPDWLAQDLVSEQWVEDRRRDWGEGSPIWQSKVEAEFPDVSDEYLYSASLIEYCRAQVNLPGLEHGQYGADIARMGTDKTVVYRARGGVIRLVAQWAKLDTMATAGRLGLILEEHPHTAIPMLVDIIGVGAGVYDRLRERGFNVGGFQGSQAAFNPAKFKNRRSELHWNFREAMESGAIDLDPEDDILAAQLGQIRWGIDSLGRIGVESKEDMRMRGINSPDHADAAMLSMVDPGSVQHISGGGRGRTLTGDLLSKVM